MSAPRQNAEWGITRPALRYHGGKFRLAPWIIQHFPPHRVYTEAFGGAASVLLRKPRANLVEVYNDLDREIVSLFEVLRCPVKSARLAEQLQLTPFAREEFNLAYQPCGDVVEQARRTVSRSFMGFGSATASGAKSGFRANGNRQTTHPARDWANYPAAVASFCQRLQGVVLECRDAVELMLQHDSPQTLHYCDPPYVHDTRSDTATRPGKGYRHEMSDEDHRKLASALHELQGMVIVSGYPSPLYDELYDGWKVSTRAALADGARERTEVLWMNAACTRALERAAGGLFAQDATCWGSKE
ncbi:DNA methyltransferase [Paracidovorax avenae]|uniref:DNA adenine methylase n=1 Tax=Paracidovorax avenae TaxID=80867 RepID=UPI000D2142D6|nr:DNA adenine methylase [Paracidovorax avenae]AVS66613.1 DNA methyltransferase [Paracidovorax avenae]